MIREQYFKPQAPCFAQDFGAELHTALCFCVACARLSLQRREKQELSPGQVRRASLQTEPWEILCSHKYQCASQGLLSYVPRKLRDLDIKYHSAPLQHFSAIKYFRDKKKMHSVFTDCFRETNLSYALPSWEGPLYWTLNPRKHAWVHIYLKALSHSQRLMSCKF